MQVLANQGKEKREESLCGEEGEERGGLETVHMISETEPMHGECTLP